MFIVNHAGNRSVDEYLLSTAFDVSTATFDERKRNFYLVKKKEQIQLHLIMMVPECLLLV